MDGHTHTHTHTHNVYIYIHIMEYYLAIKRNGVGTFMVVQWLRIHFPKLGTQVRSLAFEPRFHMPWNS